MRIWLKPKKARDMTVAEAAWLAGFFDGEGSLAPYLVRGLYPSWKMSISNTNVDALNHCVAITGAGRVNPKKQRKPLLGNRKPQWVWNVDAQRDIEAICRQMRPYLTIKLKSVASFLETWTDIQGSASGKLADFESATASSNLAP